MAILTGPEIQKLVSSGDIIIDPFNPSQINPNSYNLTLMDSILECIGHKEYFDKQGVVRIKPVFQKRHIYNDGFTLRPNTGYLASSIEITNANNLVPEIDGRSSLGRLFTLVHCTAGYGDVGFRGRWTYEIVPLIHPIIVYPGDQLCQIRFTTCKGDILPYNETGRYQNQDKPEESKGI